ncbi:hypothetical protein BLS_001080 [Venturia inaequalis]|uniref:Uncharacterized protein n=1 Tax=Venturia inaequalis TaxID=5025 RepID=A0A8H3U2W1_VENIN|nr:hypothetical protein BLS_001080 [Venturia inaequalis]
MSSSQPPIKPKVTWEELKTQLETLYPDLKNLQTPSPNRTPEDHLSNFRKVLGDKHRSPLKSLQLVKEAWDNARVPFTVGNELLRSVEESLNYVMVKFPMTVDATVLLACHELTGHVHDIVVADEDTWNDFGQSRDSAFYKSFSEAVGVAKEILGSEWDEEDWVW